MRHVRAPDECNTAGAAAGPAQILTEVGQYVQGQAPLNFHLHRQSNMVLLTTEHGPECVPSNDSFPFSAPQHTKNLKLDVIPNHDLLCSMQRQFPSHSRSQWLQ